MRPYSVVLAANELLPMAVGGEYFLLDSAPQPVSFRFFGPSNLRRDEALEDAQPGDWATPVNGFASIQIKNGALAQTVRFYVAAGRVGRFRIQGEVSVIDGGKARTLSGQAMQGQASLGGVAAQATMCEARMPAGSGKRFVMESFWLSSAVAGNVSFGHRAAALVTQQGVLHAKDLTVADGLTQMRVENAAGGGPTTPYGTVAVLASQGLRVLLTDPIIIRPNNGFLAASPVNSQFTVIFEGYEEANI